MYEGSLLHYVPSVIRVRCQKKKKKEKKLCLGGNTPRGEGSMLKGRELEQNWERVYYISFGLWFLH